jgi:hypothetical protein
MGGYAGASRHCQPFEFAGIVGCDQNATENILANHDAAKLEHLRALLGIVRLRRNQLQTTFLISPPVW